MNLLVPFMDTNRIHYLEECIHYTKPTTFTAVLYTTQTCWLLHKATSCGTQLIHPTYSMFNENGQHTESCLPASVYPSPAGQTLGAHIWPVRLEYCTNEWL